MLKSAAFTFLLVCILICAGAQPKYEFRGAWIATVVNIDWPSSKGLSTVEQKQEFVDILDSLQRDGINAVVVQVRPAADAFYPSQYEPWSEYLTGVQGKAPDPYYDPLQFMIEEAHKRGMEFHAWINPYRAVFNTHTSSVSSTHITRKHPDWFVNYGTGKYFNPGLPVVMDYVTDVVRDIIRRYDIDGLHLDDYFYPYRIGNKEFPDEKAYREYGKGMTRDEWRRSNCDSIIKRIHDVVLDVKPGIKFGISPFGVWRNKSVDPMGSDTKAGVSNYDDLYADILLWLRKGWIDYVAPQLYWPTGHPLCDFETLVKWWNNHTYGKQLLIGHGISNAVETRQAAWRKPGELPDQINILRSYANVQGSIYFSAKDVLMNPNGWADSLHYDYYRYPALIPPAPWIDTTPPPSPQLVKIAPVQNGTGFITVTGREVNQTEEIVKTYVLYIGSSLRGLGAHPAMIIAADRVNNNFRFTVPQNLLPSGNSSCFIAVTSVDKENNESRISNVLEYNSAGFAANSAPAAGNKVPPGGPTLQVISK
ncbi:MAG TPA: family 10 glycosylhydrolase [Chitinophagaceae bacterium]|nr:family 10 glycosylhydrolase [Chitinophagaceae bacterium]